MAPTRGGIGYETAASMTMQGLTARHFAAKVHKIVPVADISRCCRPSTC